MFLLVIMLIGCSHTQKYVTISGNIKNIESDSVNIGKYLYHNLTDQLESYKTTVNKKDSFNLRIPLDSADVLFFNLKHTQYPIFARPGQKITITTDAERFPVGVKVTSKSSRLNSKYNNSYQYFRYQDAKVQEAIDHSLPDFLNGKSNNILKLEKLRIRVAMEDFSNSPFEIYVFRTMGDYVIRCLENLNNHQFHSRKAFNQERNKILDEANKMGFFTLRSLMAQHSNLNDFIKEYMLSYKLEASKFPSMQSFSFSKDVNSYNPGESDFYHAVNNLLHVVSNPKAQKLLLKHFHNLQENTIRNNSKSEISSKSGIDKFVALYSNHKKYSNYLQTQISRGY